MGATLEGRARRAFVLDLGQLTVLGLLVGTPFALFLALRMVPGMDLLFQSVQFHLFVVSGIAGCALLVAVTAATAAARTRQYSLVMLTLGCLAIGFFMFGHGLATPGIFGKPFNFWVVRFPMLALTLFAACLAAALLPPDRQFARFVERHARAAIVVPAMVGALACVAAVAWPTAWIGGHALPGEDIWTKVVAAVAALTLLMTGEAHRRRWGLSGDRFELALLMACWLSTESTLSLQLGRLWYLSWWDYHALLLIGFGAAVYAVLAGYRHSRSLETTLSGAVIRDTLEQIQHGYPEAVQSLISAVEAKDSYTKGHSTRVAGLAVRIGETMGLRPVALRSLGQGGLLHDIGKIGVPDHILNKPGLLTSEEREEIEKHPGMGWEIVRQSPSLRRALTVVRHHHERFDGTGYPDRLAGREIALEARVAAVADVWDALTSDRAYRQAFPMEAALEIMLQGRGTHFDPEPLDALLALLESEGIRSTGRRPAVTGSPEIDEACHPLDAAPARGRPA
jgi:HD-GYP domain-containing protein (c-di-GMP phosphodiesterase class II)